MVQQETRANVIILLGYVLIVNIVTFLFYGWDKYSALHSGQRISENTLLGLASIGGIPAAYAARTYFRHKTIKQPFTRRLQMITIIQIGVVLLVLLLLWFHPWG